MPRELDQIHSTLDEKLRWSDLVQPFEFTSTDWHLVRPFGQVWTDFRHIITTKTGKKYYEYCLAFDESEPNQNRNDPNRHAKCECCRLEFEQKVGFGGSRIVSHYRYFMNVVLYEEVNNTYKAKGVYLLEMANSLFKKIKELKSANGGISVTHPKNGAFIQIKYDRNESPSSMYSASLDTKNTPIPQDALELIIKQKYPGGTTKEIKGKNGLPPQFEYIRGVSSEEEIIKSLRTHGYYQQQIERTPLQQQQQFRPRPKMYGDIPPPSARDMYIPEANDNMMPY